MELLEMDNCYLIRVSTTTIVKIRGVQLIFFIQRLRRTMNQVNLFDNTKKREEQKQRADISRNLYSKKLHSNDKCIFLD